MVRMNRKKVSIEIVCVMLIVAVTIVATSITYVYIENMRYRDLPDRNVHCLICNLTGYSYIPYNSISICYDNTSTVFYDQSTYTISKMWKAVSNLKLDSTYRFYWTWTIYNDTCVKSCIYIYDNQGNLVWEKTNTTLQFLTYIVAILVALTTVYVVYRGSKNGIKET